MNLKEFRVGNLIEVEGRIAEIRTIAPHQISYTFEHSGEFSKYNQHLDQIKPIQLTEQKILGLGFVKEGAYFWKTYGENGIAIIVYADHYRKFAYQLGKGRVRILDYVHRLQNIHFEVTEEELKLKD